MSWTLALILKPIGKFLLLLLVFAPAVWLAHKLPDGTLKRLLLFRIHDGERYTIAESMRLFRKRP